MTPNPRQLAYRGLKAVHRGAYADVALSRVMPKTIADADRRLLTELLYGSVRRQRTLDALIDQFAKKPAHQQPPDLRTLLHLGLYQLRFLDHIPDAAAIFTTVELAKQNQLSGLSGFVNGLLRQYARAAANLNDPLELPPDPIQHLGILYSYPDWIVQVWHDQLGSEETEKLCDYCNQPPHIDLRINSLKTDRESVRSQLASAGVTTTPLPHLPQALRIEGKSGPIPQLPGFQEGLWTVQEASAQLVGHLLNPQPGAIALDVCAAPGGKTTHIAELMENQGEVWACDRTPSRLRKLNQNTQRLGIDTVTIWTGDSRQLSNHIPLADYVLVDAPCSGLGTLHRHADARWQQTPDNIQDLSTLQLDLLLNSARRVKPGGILLYSTCTLHPLENENIIDQFLAQMPQWQTQQPIAEWVPTSGPQSSVKILPHQQNMDGFFMAILRQG
ncbi:16S rRNA (cytosine(967)-C(5))-methyltransferase [Acaryochloris marina]|uniref:16S rRNA (cytosine(967)-C(5))-methyltransferase n=1 Tax=Acaryochloris marina (strain MBIC 11017) TaxID=329726 RepID=B0CF47_ACAM1|nr:16S rRNA (cytosine(967)-C(5))-methyltransferase [Acaryochloris marina]ABW30563.1 ribosomal RNA small subunit methyltransferase B [Acaryochloris marina MBIC11017]BDM79364.1 ribosomal RNA small subunit methyltransferase B [Acaryochloris marina MBIC10699]